MTVLLTDLPNHLEDLRLVAFPNLHTVLHCHDDVLGLVLSSMLGTLLSRSCGAGQGRGGGGRVSKGVEHIKLNKLENSTFCILHSCL